MNGKQTDRRVLRTRQLLRDALVALILEKGYEAVTVQDILDRANIGRSTFYLHYWDKEALLLSGFESLRGSLEAHSQVGMVDNGEELSRALFTHAEAHHPLYKAMVGKRSGHLIRTHVQAYLSSYMREQLKSSVRVEDIPPMTLEATVHYLVGSFLALLTWWLDNDLPCSAEEMSAIFTRLTMPGLAAVLKLEVS